MAPSIATPPIVASKSGIISTPLPNPSLQVTADHQLKQVDAPVHAPKRGEVLLQIKATGICGYVRCRFTWGETLVLILLKLRHSLLESRADPYSGFRR